MKRSYRLSYNDDTKALELCITLPDEEDVCFTYPTSVVPLQVGFVSALALIERSFASDVNRTGMSSPVQGSIPFSKPM